MKTNAWNYNRAARNLAESKDIGRQETIRYITGTESVPLNLHSPFADQADLNIKRTGAYPYNSDVAIELLRILKIQATAESQRNAESIVFGSSSYRRAKETAELYETMHEQGYISLHDVEESANGKMALLRGRKEVDMFSRTYEDEKVRIVANGEHRGYRTPKMRTRYFLAQVDADLFVKIID